MLDILSELLTNISTNLGYKENLNVIKSNRLDLCDFQCNDIFNLAKLYINSEYAFSSTLAPG